MMDLDWRPPKGVLIDLDGVMYVEEQLIPGALDAITYLRQHGIPYRFLTNTTIHSRADLLAKLQRLRIPAALEQIVSPPAAAARWLRAQGAPRVHLVLLDSTKADFGEFEQDDQHPRYVIMGKMGNRWNYEMLNRIFRLLIAGAELIALHKDRFTEYEDGLSLEFGAFVAGLEYATGKPALVIGKPSPSFYHSALADLGTSAEDTVMIGDDLFSDIQGAQGVGVRGVLVRTGKYRASIVEGSPVRPDRILPSIAALPALFGG